MMSPKFCGGGVRGRLKNPQNRSNKLWTVEESLCLIELWGSKGGIPGISKILGRSEHAIKGRAHKLQLGPYLEGNELISFNKLYKTIMGEETSIGYAFGLERWKGSGLPIRMVRVQQNKFLMVSIDAFWKWAKKHQDIIDFSRFEENALGAEPEWAKRKRMIDKENRQHVHIKKCAWSIYEIERLRWLIEHGATYYDLERELKRSSAAIRRKIYDLYLPRPARCKGASWDEKELKQLVYLTNQGYSQDHIAALLHRSGQSVRGKVEFLKNRDLWKQYE